MPEVVFEVWGPIGRTNAYSWIAIEKLIVSNLDADELKKEALKILEKMEYKPTANAVRFEVLQEGRKGMKITLTDMW